MIIKFSCYFYSQYSIAYEYFIDAIFFINQITLISNNLKIPFFFEKYFKYVYLILSEM